MVSTSLDDNGAHFSHRARSCESPKRGAEEGSSGASVADSSAACWGAGEELPLEIDICQLAEEQPQDSVAVDGEAKLN